MNIEPGLYRHFKGGLYRVIGVAIDTGGDKSYVVYYAEGLENPEERLWARDVQEWYDGITMKDGTETRRFVRVEENTP